MRKIVITIRRKGHPECLVIGMFESTSAAIVHALEILGDAEQRVSISASELQQ